MTLILPKSLPPYFSASESHPLSPDQLKLLLDQMICPLKNAGSFSGEPVCAWDNSRKIFSEIVILCIGTDRMIGDSLGPLVGSILYKNISGISPVYGTLQQPIHALNLSSSWEQIKKKHPYSLIIAVDASLGPYERIGSAFIRTGCVKPGAGVNKNLPPVGHIAITGIVNEETSHPYLSLQTSRLSVVVQTAEQIADCLQQVLSVQ